MEIEANTTCNEEKAPIIPSAPATTYIAHIIFKPRSNHGGMEPPARARLNETSRIVDPNMKAANAARNQNAGLSMARNQIPAAKCRTAESMAKRFGIWVVRRYRQEERLAFRLPSLYQQSRALIRPTRSRTELVDHAQLKGTAKVRLPADETPQRIAPAHAGCRAGALPFRPSSVPGPDRKKSLTAFPRRRGQRP